MLDTNTGEVMNMTLTHEGNNVREFHSKLPRPGACGHRSHRIDAVVCGAPLVPRSASLTAVRAPALVLLGGSGAPLSFNERSPDCYEGGKLVETYNPKTG